jgi:cell division protein FtsB
MAARQDQGLVFTLITFVILFIIAFVVAYIGWKSYSDATQQIASLQEQNRNSQQAVATATDEANQMRKMVGVGENDAIAEVQKFYEADMTKYGASFDKTRQSYRDVLEYTYKEKESLAVQQASTKEENKKLTDRLSAVEAEKEKQVVQFQEQLKKSQEDLASERNSFASDRSALEKTKEELLKEVDSMRSQNDAALAERDAAVRAANEKLAKSEVAKENLMAQVSKSSESFEVPDGRITWVDQGGTVWINLGAADALRRQITFSVFDGDLKDPAKADQKGTIEVTRIIGDHMAEARITSDQLENPILTGDAIYSQVWHRGKKLRFALTGIMDLNGDGRNDMQLARDLVELNGGVVDAYLADDGSVQGEITVNTRYLVLGDFPEESNQAALQAGFQRMSEDAKTNGVEAITLDKFLNQVGYSPSDRVVQLDEGAQGGDFTREKVGQAGGQAPLENPNLFRPRTPARLPGRTPY